MRDGEFIWKRSYFIFFRRFFKCRVLVVFIFTIRGCKVIRSYRRLKWGLTFNSFRRFFVLSGVGSGLVCGVVEGLREEVFAWYWS